MEVFLSVADNVMRLSAAYFAMKSSEHLLPISDKLWKRIVLFFAYAMIITIVIFVGDRDNLPPTAILFMTAVMICCMGTPLQRFTIGLMFLSTMFAFNGFYDNLSTPHWNARLLIRLVFWAVFYLLIRRYAPPKDYELSPFFWKLILFLTLTPIGITCALVLVPNPYYTFPAFITTTFLVCFAISLFSFIGLMWTIIVLAKQRKLEMENLMADVNKRYYQFMDQRQFEVRRLRHDMANHLQILASLPSSEKDAYLAELIKSPAMGNPLHYCGDSTINAVLSTKASVLVQEQIEFEAKVDVPGELPFDKVDVCALFANALDNAIEACQKLPTGKRQITLKARAQKGLLAVNIINPIPNRNRLSDSKDLPPTTKADPHNHGLGLKSIREIVTRHGGSMEITTDGGEFQLFLYVPLTT